MKKLITKEFIAWLDERAHKTVGMIGGHEDLMQDPLACYIRQNEVRRPLNMPTWAKQYMKKCAVYPIYTRADGYEAKMMLCEIIGFEYAF